VGFAAAMTTTVYHYPKCSTCRRALAWLEARSIEHRRVDITLAPPSRAALKRAWKASGLPLAKLFNTSGRSYRTGGFKEKVKSMSEDEQLAALAAAGKLIKRPLVVGEGLALVGFDEDRWEEVLA